MHLTDDCIVRVISLSQQLEFQVHLAWTCRWASRNNVVQQLKPDWAGSAGNQRFEVAICHRKHIRFAMKDLETDGYTPGCPRCGDLQKKKHRTKKHQSVNCRTRMYLCCGDNNDPKFQAITHTSSNPASQIRSVLIKKTPGARPRTCGCTIIRHALRELP